MRQSVTLASALDVLKRGEQLYLVFDTFNNFNCIRMR